MHICGTRGRWVKWLTLVMPWDFVTFLMVILNPIIQSYSSANMLMVLGRQQPQWWPSLVPVCQQGPHLKGLCNILLLYEWKLIWLSENYLWASTYKDRLYMKCFYLSEWVILSVLYIYVICTSACINAHPHTYPHKASENLFLFVIPLCFPV